MRYGRKVVVVLVLPVALASGSAAARFVSVDPVQADSNNGQNFNRYHYANNSPYKFVDPDGRAPNKPQATGPTAVAAALDQYGLHHLQENGANGRYFYTDKFGWVDTRHFAKAAELVDSGLGGAAVRTLGFLHEVRDWTGETEQSYQSAFSPEDLPSNAAGADFGEMGQFVGESLGSRFTRWSDSVGGREITDPASGYDTLPVNDPSSPATRGSTTNYGSEPVKDPPKLEPKP